MNKRNETEISDIIKELFFGRVYPLDQLCCDSKEYKDAIHRAISANEKLAETLTQKQQEYLDAYKEAFIESNTFLELEAFRHGFQLGAQFYSEMRLPVSADGGILKVEGNDD